MKHKKLTNRKTSGFFNPRILVALLLCSIGAMMALFGAGAFSNLHAQSKGRRKLPSPRLLKMGRSCRPPIKKVVSSI
jgi:hypothetical protein